MALPDRWVTWVLGGYWSGMQLIRKHKPDVIFSTYPIASAHLIAYLLHKRTGIPWVADFRDSMTEDDYPSEKSKRRIFQWIENKVVTHCSRAIFTTTNALKMYADRYPDQPKEKWELIPNGYDEENFQRAEKKINTTTHTSITLLHSGIIYPSERDPGPLLKAISSLKQQQRINNVKIVLRATGHDELIQSLITENQIEDIVKIAPPIDYESALTEMLEAEGLLILQAANCNHQIPAKIYEYMRAQKPILALTDGTGDTATLLKKEGFNAIVPLDDSAKIEEGLSSFLEQHSSHNLRSNCQQIQPAL